MCTDNGFSHLLELNLKKLVISNARKLSGKTVENISRKCDNLEIIELSECSLLVDGVRNLVKLQKLRHVGLNYTGPISESDLKFLLSNISKSLEYLSLNGQSQLMDDVLISVADKFCVLNCLSLNECHLLSAQGLLGFFGKMKNHILQYLSVLRNTELNDNFLIGIYQKQTRLEVLNINGLISVCKNSLIKLSSCLTKLEDLDISWIRGVDDDVLMSLIQNCPKLKRLSVYGCNRISKNTLSKSWNNSSGDHIILSGNEFD